MVVLITCSPHQVIGTFYQLVQSHSSKFVAFWSRRITFRGSGDIQVFSMEYPDTFPHCIAQLI